MTQAIFLSYASQDADAARRICDALRAAGLEVWFDQSELRGRDAWDASIRKQIKECALFVPVVSATTDARSEGYFRLEWKLAVDRSHLMAENRPFFVPVILDDTSEQHANVPDAFRARQWSRLNDESSLASFASRIAKLAAVNLNISERSIPRAPLKIAATRDRVSVAYFFWNLRRCFAISTSNKRAFLQFLTHLGPFIAARAQLGCHVGLAAPAAACCRPDSSSRS